MTMSAIERLRQARMGAAAAAAPATHAATPPAAVVAPTENIFDQAAPAAQAPAAQAPAAQAPAAQAASAQAASRPAPQAMTVSRPADQATDEMGFRPLPTLVADAAQALKVFEEIAASVATEEEFGAMIAAAADGGGGMAHSLPFAQIRRNNWSVHKNVPSDIANYLPAGQRPYTAIYCGYRLGATGWIGAGSAGSANPPAWKFVLPHPSQQPDAVEIGREVMAIARKIQYTKGDDKVRFDSIGRMTLELQVLCWRPEIGFLILVCPGFKTASDLAVAINGKGAAINGVPLTFNLTSETIVNKKVAAKDPSAKNAEWTEDVVSIDVQSNRETQKIWEDWNAHKASNPVQLANAIVAFRRGADYEGLSFEDVTGLVMRYHDEGLLAGR